MPSAYTRGEGNLFYAGSNNELVRFGALTATPYDWLEATYFYNYQRDRLWGTKLGFLDKGFNVKFAVKNFTEYRWIPDIAIGLIDFAGTGFYTSEYVVGSYRNHLGSLSLGVGFGKLNGVNSIKNPLGSKINHFSKRRTKSFGLGGSPSYSSWFTGDMSIFWGIAINIPNSKGTKVVIERDTFDYGFEENRYRKAYVYPERREKKSNYNIGISFSITENFSLLFSTVRGQSLNINYSFGGNFSKPFFKKKQKFNRASNTKIFNNELDFYEDILSKSNKKQLYVQSIEIEDKALKIAISQPKYRDMNLLSKDLLSSLPSLEDKQIDDVEITLINANVEISKISINTDALDQNYFDSSELYKRKISYGPGAGTDYLNNKFLPRLVLPQFSYSLGPSVINHLGSPEQFYFGGLIAKLSTNTLFTRNISLQTEMGFGIVDNFDGKRSSPGSKLPRVRTEIVNYLQEGSDFHISRMQLNYIDSPYSQVFTRISAGILEQMYNGYGLEVLYRPFWSNFAFGVDAHKVFKRTYDQKFEMFKNFKRWETTTWNFNTYHFFEPLQIITHLSFGKYLAKDKGYTLDVSRKMKSGFRVGAFFTRTDVPARLFGEGSFDKGIYFQVPIELFIVGRTLENVNFQLRPLTRDGGQKLNAGSDLYGITSNSQLYEF